MDSEERFKLSPPRTLALWFAIVSVIGCATPLPAPQLVEGLGTNALYSHKHSSIQFPPIAGRLARTHVTEYDPNGFDASGHYTSRSLGTEGTVYFYPGTRGSGLSESEIQSHFLQVCRDVAVASDGARQLIREARVFRVNRSKMQGLFSTFAIPRFGDAETPITSYLFLVPVENYYLKFRFSHPEGETEGEAAFREFLNAGWWSET